MVAVHQAITHRMEAQVVAHQMFVLAQIHYTQESL